MVENITASQAPSSLARLKPVPLGSGFFIGVGYKVFAAPLCACFYRSVKICAAQLGYAHPLFYCLLRIHHSFIRLAA